MRTRLLGPRSRVRFSGAKEQRDEPSLALLNVELADESDNLEPLFETIVESVPAPTEDADAPFPMPVHNTIHDDYVGRIAIGRTRAARLAGKNPARVPAATSSSVA